MNESIYAANIVYFYFLCGIQTLCNVLLFGEESDA